MKLGSYAVIDTGPLVAVADSADVNHLAAVRALADTDLRFVLPATVVTEALYLIGDRFGPTAEARFVAGLRSHDIRLPEPEDWSRIAQLIETYRDFPLGGVDASVVVMAERLNTDLIVTFDHRHFHAIRPRHVNAFRLLPE